MFRPFSRLLGAMQDIANALRDVAVWLQTLVELQKSAGPASERLEALELSRHQWEAMCEGLLAKAEGKWRAANNAETRERAHRKSYEHLLDPLDEVGVEPETAARHPDSGNDVSPSEAERLSALRLDVAPSPKELAKRAKFGVR